MNKRWKQTKADLFSGPLTAKQKIAILNLLEYAQDASPPPEVYGTFNSWPDWLRENLDQLTELKNEIRRSFL